MEDKEIMEMREQIATLRNKLEKEQIVTERLLKQAMKKSIGIIRRQAVKEYIMVCICFILYPFLYYVANLSALFISTSLLIFIGCATATWYFQRPINDKLLGEDVDTVVRVMTKLKRQYQLWIIGAMPIMIPWVFWFWKEYTTAMNVPEEVSYFMLGTIIVGACIGGAIGYSWDRKVIRSCNEIIAQLKE